MARKTQMGLELIFIILGILTVVGGAVYYGETTSQESSIESSVDTILNQIETSISTVALMGYPARDNFEVYVPSNIIEDSSFIANQTVNYGVSIPYQAATEGTDNMYRIFDYCVQGSLPTSEGYHTVNVISLPDCILIEYEDIFLDPEIIIERIPVNTETEVTVDFVSLIYSTTNIILSVEGEVANYIDLDPSTPGMQTTLDLGEVAAGTLLDNTFTFYGTEVGTYTGYLYYNEFRIEVTLIVYPAPPVLPEDPEDIQINASSITACNSVCVNATITQGEYPVSNVWASFIDSEGNVTTHYLTENGCGGNSTDGVYELSVALGGVCCGEEDCSECNYNNINCGYSNGTNNYFVEYEAEEGKYDELRLESTGNQLGDNRIYETDTIIIDVSNDNGWVYAAIKNPIQGPWHNYTSDCSTYYDESTGFRMTLVSIENGTYTFDISTNCNSHALSNIDFNFGDGAVITSPTSGIYQASRVCGEGENVCNITNCDDSDCCSSCSCEADDDEENGFLIWTIDALYANDTYGTTVSYDINPNIQITTNCD